MTLEIKQQITKTTKKNAGTNNRVGVAIHETANTSQGAGAQAHANLQSGGNVRQASWHYQVDDKLAIQSFEHTIRCWHAGDGSGPGNNQHVAIEICVNPDSNYVQACKNAAELVRVLRSQGVGTSLKQHNAFSGKDCPNFMREGRDGVTWAVFQEWVANGTGSTPPPTPPPAASGLVVDGLWGRATTNRLQQVLGTVADGEIWGQYSKNKQPAFVDGWVYNYPNPKGSPVVSAFQGHLGVGQDGVWGADTTRALQSRYGLVVDGELWAPSPAVAELQRRLNVGTV